MSIHIKFNLIHPYFREPLRVGVEWGFPFLPRIGESVNAWIWIEEEQISREKVEKLLTKEGKESLAEYDFSKETSLNNWLYEVGVVTCSNLF